MTYASEHDGILLPEVDYVKSEGFIKGFPKSGDTFEETMIEMIVGFTELIDRVDRALPSSDFKTELIKGLREVKRETTTHVINTLKEDPI